MLVLVVFVLVEDSSLSLVENREQFANFTVAILILLNRSIDYLESIHLSPKSLVNKSVNSSMSSEVLAVTRVTVRASMVANPFTHVSHCTNCIGYSIQQED